MLQTHVRKNALELFRVARKYCRLLWVPGEAMQLLSMSNGARRTAMASMANLAKFLGMYKVWKEIVEETGLKWSGGSSEDLIIGRLVKVKDAADIIEWIRAVKEAIPKFSVFMDFAAATGMRFSEIVNSYNLINELGEGRLAEYYNVHRNILEHYKFKDIFIRRSKKVFISFAAEGLVESVRLSGKLTRETLENKLKRAGLGLRFGDIREYWASYMTRHLSQPEIDFLQGRVSASVFMRNYFNPAWISDLQVRALKAASEILAKISEAGGPQNS